MDRTFSSISSVPKSSKPKAFSIDSGLYSESRGDSTHALFAPMHYEPKYAYPLIVWLHGDGDEERQLLRIMPLMSMRNYVAVAPRGSVCEVAATDVRRYGWRQTDRHVSLAEQGVFESIELARAKYHVDLRRVFLAGFDSGGTMAFRVALSHPSRFRGVVSLGGPLPTGRPALGNLQEARTLAILLAIGQHSTTYQPEQACDDLRLLHTAGMFVTLRQYPCAHEISPQMLVDVDRWIIEQITNPRPNPANSHAE
ncbi:MAG: alpha/beta hydrolase-fold protein [Patescibacteria group bacterium]|nr:alpha/beta hydrolase-fold protein [Patescibacteria group bacterium]